MAEAKHIKKCKKLISNLEKKEYFSAALTIYNNEYNTILKKLCDDGIETELATSKAFELIFSHLCDIMQNAQTDVENIINRRIESGEIHDAKQASKSVAGNLFQQFVAYTLAKNVIVGNINKNVIISTSANILNEYAVIKVGDDAQKPDSDILVYEEDNLTSPILNFSCKTSCRERAGQTYKWKLLSDLATCNCPYKKDNSDCPVTSYGLQYNPQREIYVGFITADFYNELDNPQIAGIFNFFDFSYIAKETSPSDRIKTLDNIIADINNSY